MTSVLSQLKKQAAELPEHERAELALSLIESLDGPADADVERLWEKEIERRVRQLEAGEAELIPADQVFTRIRHKLG